MTANVRYFGVTLLALFAFLILSSGVAHAYVDPGTGLLVYQSMTAFATGVMFYFRRRLKLFLFRKAPEAEKTAGERLRVFRSLYGPVELKCETIGGHG